MSLWQFRVPTRFQHDLEGLATWSLWTRVRRSRPPALVRHESGTWEELASLPMPVVPEAFTGTSDTYQRLYMGGHNYIINDALKTELEAAVTAQEAGGYDAYIEAAPGGAVETGDELQNGSTTYVTFS